MKKNTKCVICETNRRLRGSDTCDNCSHLGCPNYPNCDEGGCGEDFYGHRD